MKTYLVTGGAGYIGSNFIKFILEKYKQEVLVINFDKLVFTSNLNYLKSVKELTNYKFIKGDIENVKALENVFQEYDIDYVVNFAEESFSDENLDSLGFSKTNSLGVKNILEVAKKYWLEGEVFKEGKRFIQGSSYKVYGFLSEKSFFVEKDILTPKGEYSKSKEEGELLVKSYYKNYKMPVNIIRAAKVYGIDQQKEEFIPFVFNRAVEGKKMPVYGSGNNLIDFIYIEDLCSGINSVINKGALGEIYNISGGKAKEELEAAKAIIKVLIKKGVSVKEDILIPVQVQKPLEGSFSLNINKIKNELGWTPKVDFEEGMSKTIEWYLNDWYLNYM